MFFGHKLLPLSYKIRIYSSYHFCHIPLLPTSHILPHSIFIRPTPGGGDNSATTLATIKLEPQTRDAGNRGSWNDLCRNSKKSGRNRKDKIRVYSTGGWKTNQITQRGPNTRMQFKLEIARLNIRQHHHYPILCPPDNATLSVASALKTAVPKAPQLPAIYCYSHT